MSLIGVIDSGVGGLTILKSLQATYKCDYCYVADHAYCPYGIKSEAVILERVDRLITYLEKRGAACVVLACNTASVFAEELRKRHIIPLYDVITPTCELIAKTTKNKNVALLATNFTIDSGIYSAKLAKYGINVTGFKCSKFVPYIESGSVTSISCLQTIKNTLSGLSPEFDTVALCCTHFPIIKRQIAAYVHKAAIVECCSPKTDGIEAVDNPQTEYLTTGNVDFANSASKWFGKVEFKHISL